MTIDLTPLVQALAALAFAAISATIPVVVPVILKRLRLANNAELATRIENAADAGAGLAYRYAVAHEGGLSHLAVQDAALAAGVNHVAASVPDALATLGVTPDHVGQMVTARLGALLATDPTVTAGTPTVAPVAVPDAAPVAALVPAPIPVAA